ncbi:Putative ribonuclease H protein [Dendrobium catenatum]|uniref:Ribonuclease H protein n=1 Tax=Dendrobium catenatum TaxID=906689 RepID=A0A2I0X971_9ASPA|nr:Putative ribonuclease H protein [Dendrobium catenatum]
MRRLTVADFSKVMRIAFEKIILWGRKHLPLAGRALLIKTSLLSVPMYAMTHTSIPNGVLMTIERMGRQFLWQKDANSRGMHYVGWKELCQSTDLGGLGFHCLIQCKGALRARVVWDLIQNKDSIIYKVLVARYGMNLWDYVQGKKVSITWKVIQDGAKALRPILRWNIMNGSQIDVIQDVWIMNRNIAKWPTFVNFEEVENMKVCNLLNNSFQWNEEMVKHCFGNTMADRILAINISTESLEDNPELIYSRMSMTVVAMAYRDSELWCPPPLGLLKFNFDAALLPSNQVGLCVIARNQYGKLIVAAGRKIEHWDALQAEMLAAMAIREVFMDWMFELDGIIIEGDCINAIRWLQRLNDRQNVIHRRVEGPDTALFLEFKQVLFQYTPRNSNRVADFCAHLALVNEFTFFDVNNSEFHSTLLPLLREESDRV